MTGAIFHATTTEALLETFSVKVLCWCTGALSVDSNAASRCQRRVATEGSYPAAVTIIRCPCSLSLLFSKHSHYLHFKP